MNTFIMNHNALIQIYLNKQDESIVVNPTNFLLQCHKTPEALFSLSLSFSSLFLKRVNLTTVSS